MLHEYQPAHEAGGIVVLEFIWPWPSLPHLFLVQDSPVNFKVWLANADPRSLYL